MSIHEKLQKTTLDGIHAMVPRDQMAPGARKLRDAYARVPGAPFYQKEFGFYCLDQWKTQGMPADVAHEKLFGYDPNGTFALRGLGWCEAGFEPAFEEKIIESRGEHEVWQDFAGRHVLCFKGRRSGFMPEYIDHPVKDAKSWEEKCKRRLDPNTPERFGPKFSETIENAKKSAAQGMMISQRLVGGYMYLRSLIGPDGVLYMVYDNPALIHDCMQTWFALADRVIAEHQKHVTLDEIFIGEDICYNHGPLISPDMIHEFLSPYYSQLLKNVKARQIDKTRHLYFQVDTDGFADPVIPLYMELGMDVMSPFEVASHCDVIRTGREYPELAIFGGVDKRALAKGRAAIDELVDRIFPVMQKRGGFIPTCDHGVPEEVRYDDYLYFRKRCLEFA
jgi:uroporphyrinogen decarboxylase